MSTIAYIYVLFKFILESAKVENLFVLNKLLLIFFLLNSSKIISLRKEIYPRLAYLFHHFFAIFDSLKIGSGIYLILRDLNYRYLITKNLFA